MKTALLLVLAVVFCSCAASIETLQRVTAQEAGNTLSRDVTIYNVNRGITSISWQAKTMSGCYECDADDLLKRVNCAEVECSKIDTTKHE